ncbi:MAG: hypothetical protein NVV60_02625 [Luteimonas sp.]|nr:hypothetical protein [Luteimonas sp.]
MLARCLLPSLLCFVAVGCQVQQDAAPPVAETVEVASPEEGGAVSTAPVEPANGTQPNGVARPEPGVPLPVDWSSPVELASGQAWVSCDLDYATAGDGMPLDALAHEDLNVALTPCMERGVMRLRYKGKIAADFTALVQRLALVAEELSIDKRVLDLDSSGGLVEDAMRAGDVIAETHWTVWVREDAVCHSACMFILAAGDVRMISGRVGIHRIIRMSSTATTRVQLNKELRAVYGRVRDYLERNGVAVAVADLMMAVPNRSLRLLTAAELQEYGLDGINPVQDDLDRLQLMRRCGEDFVSRRDAFARAFDARCKRPDAELDALNACGLELRRDFGFPDQSCPAESPLSEFDTVAEGGEGADSDAAAAPASGAGIN